jgi:2,3-diketo-5-methylthiopentyl-1-phosphate enolase
MLDPLAWSNQEGIDAEQYIIATYLMTLPTRQAMDVAQAIAYEQSTGTWTHVPADTEAVRVRSLAKVLGVHEIPNYEDRLPEGVTERSFIVHIAFPAENINKQFPQMLTAVLGNISMSGKLKVLDIRLPKSFVKAFPGPAFGVEGVRKAAGLAPGTPPLCAMFKPCTGAPASVLADMLYELGMGGCNVVKDDELLADPTFCTIDERLDKILKKVDQVKKETGRTVLYALNVTDAPKKQEANIKRALKAGANCLMFNVPTIGWASFAEAVEQIGGRVPVLAHPDFAGAYFASPHYGVSSQLILGKFMRLAGADIVVCPSAYGKVPQIPERVLQLAVALRSPFYDLKPTLPAPSAGMHQGQVQQLLNDFGPDTVVAAGGGYHGHPGGARMGAVAFTQAVDAWLNKTDLRSAARSKPELKAALDKWGVYTPETPTQYALTN